MENLFNGECANAHSLLNQLVAGVDEAGRGALAGPVVSAAVILTPEIPSELLKDSKTLKEQEREEIYEILYSSTPYIGIGVVNEKIVDRINILQATLLSMEKAIMALPILPQKVLIDGRDIPKNINLNMSAIIKGDSKIPAISAASIIAKVTRDRIMCKLHKAQPQYNFNKHKGYGTEDHYDCIFKFGISKSHRKSFNLTKQEKMF